MLASIDPRKKIYSITQAAALCKLNRVTLWRWIRSGKLRAYQTPTGQYRIKQEDLESFIQNDLSYLQADLPDNHPTILIIDDDPQFRKLVRKIVANDRFDIEEAGNGFEAGLKIIKHMPSILILDLFMPEIDGFDICRQVKSDPNTRAIRIIVVTGAGSPETEEKVRQLGADAYFTKPVGRNDLKACIEKLTQKER
jgi:excisionase family DNA binding protein